MREILPESQLDPAAMQAVSSFHQNVVNEVKEAIRSNKIVVVGMGQNPFVKKARKLLEEKTLPFKYLEYGNYFSMWRPRLAIKLWTGWPTFPQVFIDGKLIGGFTELNAYLNKTQPRH